MAEEAAETEGAAATERVSVTEIAAETGAAVAGDAATEEAAAPGSSEEDEYIPEVPDIVEAAGASRHVDAQGRLTSISTHDLRVQCLWTETVTYSRVMRIEDKSLGFTYKDIRVSVHTTQSYHSPKTLYSVLYSALLRHRAKEDTSVVVIILWMAEKLLGEKKPCKAVETTFALLNGIFAISAWFASKIVSISDGSRPSPCISRKC